MVNIKLILFYSYDDFLKLQFRNRLQRKILKRPKDRIQNLKGIRLDTALKLTYEALSGQPAAAAALVCVCLCGGGGALDAAEPRLDVLPRTAAQTLPVLGDHAQHRSMLPWSRHGSHAWGPPINDVTHYRVTGQDG